MRIPRGHPQYRPEMSLLGWSSFPPGLDEDSPTVTAVAPPVAVKHGGTYEIPNRLVNPINIGTTLNPQSQESPVQGRVAAVSQSIPLLLFIFLVLLLGSRLEGGVLPMFPHHNVSRMG
jgi:hypothetical protein